MKPTTPCQMWPKAIKNNGYGVRWFKGRLWHAHRAAYVEAYGAIPDGLHIDHLCGNRACVRPDHLEAIAQAEHNKRHAANRTHCPHGHPLDGWRQSGRYCKTCKRAYQRRYRERKQALIV